MNEVNNLLPCPMCGGHVDLIHKGYKTLDNKTFHFICKDCGASFFLPHHNKYENAEKEDKEAAQLWNDRLYRNTEMDVTAFEGKFAINSIEQFAKSIINDVLPSVTPKGAEEYALRVSLAITNKIEEFKKENKYD
ncbi:MAG: Lar family restriction alleviation protein [Bacteroidales bacterium]|nr:Lar family restriction alleviation protein [Bacteroidales bacterium]